MTEWATGALFAGVTTRFALPWPHVILALAVVAVWGTNFVVIKFALAHLPPLTLAALRFASVVFPAIFFFRRPRVSVSISVRTR